MTYRSFTLMLALLFGATLYTYAARAAPQFPFRDDGPERTAYMDSALRNCRQANWNTRIPKGVVNLFCECKHAGLAYSITAQDVDEMMQGGIHITPHYDELSKSAEAACVKMITGK